jgi:structural maintenance of chromosome 3 (chondroitin sulfate proteoglycan 6)
VNAFVEVVFDNSDNRFSLEHSDEVVLRRTVGSKKDEFFLQRKRATKQEVQSLLEGAGFSKSNPYFMVQQGKIQTLCLMKDIQRLELLQQVAGTTLYEDKKGESLVKMQENAQSVEKINSILVDIDQRLNELKGEKEELTVYQNCDRTRKALEYTLYDKELRKARHMLDVLEHERMDHLHTTANLHEALKETHEQIQNAEGELQIKTMTLRRNRRQLQDSETDKIKAVTLKTKLDLKCQELQEQLATGKETLQRTEQDLEALEVQIQTAQEQLQDKEQAHKEEQAALQQLLQEKDQANRKADGLYAKQGRGKQYSSKAERDRSLTKQIKELEVMQGEKQEVLQQQQDSLGHLRRQITTSEETITSTQAEVKSKQESLQSIRKTLEEKQRNLHSLMDVRKHTWRKAEELQESLKDNRDHMQKCVSDVRKSMPRATAMGLKALQRIVEEERIVVGEQYFGMVMENMTLKDPKYQTCVEVAAQNALFHVIVDTDATAARLMEHLERKKLGRITFMPLNRLRAGYNTRYPQSNDVTPLLDMCIEFDPRVGRAMEHVFDKKLLAKSAEVASEWSSKVHMDCITLDGDLCSRKGALTGGYLDQAKSRLRAYTAQRKAENDYREMDQGYSKVDVDAKKTEQDVTNASQEVSRLENKQSQLSRMVHTLESKLTSEQSQFSQHKKQAVQIESQIMPPIDREIAAFSGDIGRLQEEIGTELTTTLSDDDRTQLTELKDTMKELQSKITVQSEQVEELRVDRQKLESLLEDNLLKRRQELNQVFRDDAGEMVVSSAETLMEQKKSDLEDARQTLLDANKDLTAIDEKLEQGRSVEEELKGELLAAKQELDKLKSRDIKNSTALDEANEMSEKLMSKVSLFMQKQSLGISWIQAAEPVILYCSFSRDPCTLQSEKTTCARFRTLDPYPLRKNLCSTRINPLENWKRHWNVSTRNSKSTRMSIRRRLTNMSTSMISANRF